jgi:hypothetical protein
LSDVHTRFTRSYGASQPPVCRITNGGVELKE